MKLALIAITALVAAAKPDCSPGTHVVTDKKGQPRNYAPGQGLNCEACLPGTFAEQHIWDFSEQQLTEYEAILNEETIDLFNFITKKEPVPQELCSDVMDLVQAWCANNPLGTTPEQYAAVKREVPGLT